ncbi:F-box protein [Dorcoceras hygrometricum]|uniref:F-box protein n=1 Tax=Dorcoceras hygrometricum TaxID=472368 RepID=A0A2Z6ZW21_9LAMI|nr:F-box protein [Dorcoceras hygrometricum]
MVPLRVARWPCEWSNWPASHGHRAADVRKLLRMVAGRCSLDGARSLLVARMVPCWSPHDGARLSRACRGPRATLRRTNFHDGAAAAGRRSGDVVTADFF